MTVTGKATNPTKSRLTVVQDSICTACGCLCDDIDVTVQDNRIVKAERACELARPWFFDSQVMDRPICSIEGRASQYRRRNRTSRENSCLGESSIDLWAQ